MINDRINKLMMVAGVNMTDFSKAIGVKPTVIFNIIKGRKSNPSLAVILKIIEKYPELNTKWFLSGEGSMWNDDVVRVPELTPTFVHLENRINQLLSELKLTHGPSVKLTELEELIHLVLSESSVQKIRLIDLAERQQRVLDILKQNLKLD